MPRCLKRHWVLESTSAITTVMLFTDHVIFCEPALNCSPSCGTLFLCPFYITTHNMRILVWLIFRNFLRDEVHIWMVHSIDKLFFGCVVVSFPCHQPCHLQYLRMMLKSLIFILQLVSRGSSVVIWICWFFRREENRITRRKSLGVRWKPTTNSTHIWHRTGIEPGPHGEGGEPSHHYVNSAP